MTIDKQEIKDLALACEPARCADEAEEERRLCDFYSECGPEVVLALLAEIERLESEAMHTAAGVQSDREQMDQLKAENEALRDGANFRAIQSLRADCEALRKDAERYRWLRDQHPNAFHLERNTGNSVNYCTVAQWIEDNPEWFEGTPADDLAKMAQTNSHWQIQIYPDTPIGFHVTSRATLDEVIDAVKAEESAL